MDAAVKLQENLIRARERKKHLSTWIFAHSLIMEIKIIIIIQKFLIVTLFMYTLPFNLVVTVLVVEYHR